MKSWTLSDELQARPELAAAVERLRPVVDGYVIPPRSAPLVSAAWRLEVDDKGRDVVALRLTEPFWPAGVEERFAPQDVDPANHHLRAGLHLLWVELLGAANEVRIERLLQEAGAD